MFQRWAQQWSPVSHQTTMSLGNCALGICFQRPKDPSQKVKQTIIINNKSQKTKQQQQKWKVLFESHVTRIVFPKMIIRSYFLYFGFPKESEHYFTMLILISEEYLLQHFTWCQVQNSFIRTSDFQQGKDDRNQQWWSEQHAKEG